MAPKIYAIVRRRNYWSILPEYVYPITECKLPFSELRSLLHQLFKKLIELQNKKLYSRIEQIDLYICADLFYTILPYRTYNNKILIQDIYQRGDWESFEKVFDYLSAFLYSKAKPVILMEFPELSDYENKMTNLIPKVPVEINDRRSYGCYQPEKYFNANMGGNRQSPIIYIGLPRS